MRYTRAVLLLLVLVTSCYGKTLDFNSTCCPEDLLMDEHSNCINDGDIVLHKVNLSCAGSGAFIVNPNENEDDEFMEDEKGGLKVGPPGITTAFYIRPERWCAGLPIESKKDPSVKPIALACFDDDSWINSDGNLTQNAMLYVYGVCIFVSVIFLVLTLVVYTVLPELRDLQGHCLMANVASLALGYTGLAIIQLQSDSIHVNSCIFLAFFIYFWLLSAFFWLNVVSFNVWRGVMMQGRGRRLVRETRLFGFYCAYAWGVPCCFLAASLATHFAPGHLELLRPNFGNTKCWFDARQETWAYFYGPVAVLLFCNVVFFASTAYTLWSSRSDDIQRIRSHRFKCVLYLKLFIVMGITWIFEVISFAHGENLWFWNIMDILNALQGILIFVIMVIRKRTMRAIASRKWGAALCPKSHQLLTGGVDEEESEPVIAEEVELARPNMSTIVVTA